MNRLNQSSSPYLKQHENNPVHWWSWGLDALAEAKLRNKPILVSVGYSTCHWCHVMAHESFEDIEVANIMNEYFINIKVDREERPDIDHYLMDAIQLMGVSGGWPLHCFLTPDLKPFFGGTYFPPEPKYGRPSWSQILVSVHQAFVHKTNQIVNSADKLAEELRNQYRLPILSDSSLSEHSTILNEAFQQIKSFWDKEYGGFGFGQKFPNTTVLRYLINHDKYRPNQETNEHINKSVQMMCLGGIFDHLAGGYSRYTVDRQWMIPHFEKMAYDQALILRTLSELYNRTKDSFYLYFIEKSTAFWESDMKLDNGLFIAAIDADSEGKEGAFYVWEVDEIKDILGRDIELFLKYFKLNPFEHSGEFVLSLNTDLFYLNKDANQVLWQLKFQLEKLLENRNLRISPSKDIKQILAWNALMITAYCQVFKNTGIQAFRENALKGIRAITDLYVIQSGTFLYARTLTHNKQEGKAFLEDYAYLLEAFIACYQISFDNYYITCAENLVDHLNKYFKQGHFLYSLASIEQSDSLEPIFDSVDSAIPNPNAVICESLMLLYHITANENYFNDAKSMIYKVTQPLKNGYFQHASWLSLLIKLEHGWNSVKAKDPLTVLRYFESLYINDLILILDTNLNMDEIQYCSGSVCYPKVTSHAEMKELYNQLNFGKN